jgi:thioredoxin 1
MRLESRDVTSRTWDDSVLAPGKQVMVIFWAEWCEPSRKMCDIVATMDVPAGTTLMGATLNIDDNVDIATRYKISIVPTLMVFQSGRKTHHLICLQSEEALLNIVEELRGR